MGFALAAGMMAMASALTQQAFGAGQPGEDGGTMGLTGKSRHKGKGQHNRRGKGAVSRPKKRPNMNHVSRRTKRKHRRAA